MKKKHAMIAVCTFVVLTVVYLAIVLFVGKKPTSTVSVEEMEQVNNDSILTDSIPLNK